MQKPETVLESETHKTVGDLGYKLGRFGIQTCPGQKTKPSDNLVKREKKKERKPVYLTVLSQ